jgi:hypothetical protein
MPITDGFDQDHPLPLLLADKSEEQGVEKVRHISPQLRRC